MKKFGMLILGMLAVTASRGVCDTYTLESYYPVPYGSHSRFQLVPFSDQVDPCDDGKLYTKTADNTLQFCTDQRAAAGRWVKMLPHIADMDLDGQVMITDAEIIEGLALGYSYVGYDGRPIPADGSRGDINLDGSLTSADAVVLKNIITINQFGSQPDFRKGYFFADDNTGMPALAVGGTEANMLIGFDGFGEYTVPSKTVGVEDFLGVGTIDPQYPFDVAPASGPAAVRIYSVAGQSRLYLQTGDVDNDSSVYFGDGVDQEIGAITYHHIDDSLTFLTNNTEALRIFANGFAGIGTAVNGPELTINGNLRAQGLYLSSDRKLKDQIQTMVSALEKILQLEGRIYSWKKDGRHDIGFIAQEVEEVFPEVVFNQPATGLKGIKYESLIAPVIEAIREQQQLIEELQAELANIKAGQTGNQF